MSKLTLAAVAGVAAAIAAGSLAFAAVPDGSGVIHGCYGKPGTVHAGYLRAIDTAQNMTCTSSELPLDWNQQGLPGQKGDKGDQGDPGAPGSTTAYITRTAQVALPNLNKTTPANVATLSLPAGSYEISVTGSVTRTGAAPELDALCSLKEAGFKIDEEWANDDESFSEAIAMNEVVAPASTVTVALSCASHQDNNSMANVRMTATEIQSVVTQ
jgi:hypothetical protein